MLTDDEIRRFHDDGFVAVRGAFPRSVADACAVEIWAALPESPDDPSTWTVPVRRLDGFGTPPFAAAAQAPVLHEAFDQLVGPGRWVARTGLGTIPVRFPSPDEPGDDGWHVEGSFAGPDGGPRVNLRSDGRALLMLFLFADVGPDDAPTRIRVGSHLDVPPFLADVGDEGRAWMAVCQDVVPASAHRPVATADGAAGDVFLCHPFLVHAAQPHRGTRPRLMAQPPLEPAGPPDLDAPFPVATAIRAGLRS
ncbi:phytanoyl-CoA dioxygenase family protein [Actinomycetospora sp. CA-084318]|uniref:phytanoyl-CoA dioxygenase family protein n=1 Tax=Actinomycetospora sp. CA-084318 TaxID=3239892 RepID=UPI003D961D96